MTWIVPEVVRRRAAGVAGERAALDGWLDAQRDTLLWKCRGLAPEQLCLRPVEPSTMSLLGLVRHLAEVERGWFRRCFGQDVPYLFCSEERPDGDFDDVEPAYAEADFAAYLAECDLARAAVAGLSLDETSRLPSRPVDLRWVYLHMIEEYARHNGHADLLRERIDGVTGS